MQLAGVFAGAVGAWESEAHAEESGRRTAGLQGGAGGGMDAAKGGNVCIREPVVGGMLGAAWCAAASGANHATDMHGFLVVAQLNRSCRANEQTRTGRTGP